MSWRMDRNATIITVVILVIGVPLLLWQWFKPVPNPDTLPAYQCCASDESAADFIPYNLRLVAIIVPIVPLVLGIAAVVTCFAYWRCVGQQASQAQDQAKNSVMSWLVICSLPILSSLIWIGVGIMTLRVGVWNSIFVINMVCNAVVAVFALFLVNFYSKALKQPLQKP